MTVTKTPSRLQENTDHSVWFKPVDGLPEVCGESDLLDVYQRSADPAFAGQLFATAAQLRDRHLGGHPWWSAGISAITPCEVEPLCTYCTFFTRAAAAKEDIAAAARAIADLGIRHLHLSGGTRLAEGGGTGYDAQIIEMVQAIQAVTDIEIEINPISTPIHPDQGNQ
ncbi:MAG: hypothetical protein ABT22_07830 [Thiobacillus sp. SCN 64-317]|nr:hypothetical protein [Thiobacillus sp.]ODV12029.1 MAG: hypothetical protein ABT22_07830 [Thiobacillus sp. SCN 64-317]